MPLATEADRTRLLELLRIHGFRRGEFTLTSGAKSDFFIDCKPVMLSAEGHLLIAKLMTDAMMTLTNNINAVAGVELGGCALASAVSLHSQAWTYYPVGAIYVRKAPKGHGTGKQLEVGSDVATVLEHNPRDNQVIVLEDTITTGGSTLRAIEALERDRKFQVVGVVAIVDRCEGGVDTIKTSAGVPVAALYTRHDFMGDGQ